ncbi:MAG: GNAT family N-acetyltransferase [Cyclobacteriaceae bacterium]|jgi:ribosomal protein S18 acetylase RimI-like enzyme|nr:GNAT family N-acetyltransferase [Cytophagales bacterium]MCZ8327949.1 GNAT family N-acetyltransferase [Cyclobacteriaceae bacterium]
MLHYSKAESDRFGYRIFRGNLDEIQIDQILSILLKENVEIAIVRLPVKNVRVVQHLQKNNIQFILADTLLYYTLHPTATPTEINYGIEVEPYQDYHSEILNHLVHSIFSAYKNHYSHNALLNSQFIAPGYFEWITTTCKGQQGKCWLLKYNQQFAGFIACKFTDKTCEIILNGVLPAFANRGIYTNGLKHVIHYCEQNQYTTILISTQIDNVKVQRVWQNLNFKLSHGYYTIHILSKEISLKYTSLQ